MILFILLQKIGEMGLIWYPLVLFLGLLCVLAQAEYVKYKDPKQPLGVRIKDLMGRMTLEEKVGQMTQIERKLATPDIMAKYFIGTLIFLYFMILFLQY